MKIIYFTLALVLAACGTAGYNHEKNKPTVNTSKMEADSNNGYEKDYAEKTPSATEIENKLKSNLSIPDKVTPKLIRTADLRFQVNNLEKSTDEIENIVKKYSAYISNANMNASNSESNNLITIRVPNKDFDDLLKAISKESIYMERKNVSTQDVTEEYVDIEARLKTKKEVEARYVEILKAKAKTVQEVLDAENQIRVIREEIEAREGRLNYLQNQISYSTISVQIFQQIEYADEAVAVTESFSHKAGSGFSQGWSVIQNFAIGIITLWPLWIFGFLLYFFIKKIIKKYSTLNP